MLGDINIMYIVRWLLTHPLVLAWSLAVLAILLNFGMGSKHGEEKDAHHAATEGGHDYAQGDAHHAATPAPTEQAASQPAAADAKSSTVAPAVAPEAPVPAAPQQAAAPVVPQTPATPAAPVVPQTPVTPATPAAPTTPETAALAPAPVVEENTVAPVPAPTPEVAPAPVVEEKAAAPVPTPAPEAAVPVVEEKAAEPVPAPATNVEPAAVTPATPEVVAEDPHTVVAPAQEPTAVSSENLLLMARSAYQKGDMTNSIQYYQQLIKQTPDNLAYKGELGNVYWRSGQPKEAAALYVEIAPDMIKAGHRQDVMNMLGFISIYFPEKVTDIQALLQK